MYSKDKRIRELQNMIDERESLLKDEMTRNILGDSGIEVVEYFIRVYKQRILDLQFCTTLLPKYYRAFRKALGSERFKHHIPFILDKIRWLESTIYSPIVEDMEWVDFFLDMG